MWLPLYCLRLLLIFIVATAYSGAKAAMVAQAGNCDHLAAGSERQGGRGGGDRGLRGDANRNTC